MRRYRYPILLATALILGGILPAGGQDKFKEGLAPGGDPAKFKTDREFAAGLRSGWQKAELSPGLIPDETPKPDRPPVAPRPSAPPDWRRGRTVTVPPPAVRSPAPSVAPPEIASPASFTFFEAPVTLDRGGQAEIPLPAPVTQSAIAAWWEAQSALPYSPLLAQAQDYRHRLNLNDWGYARLLYDLGRTLHRGNPNSAALFAGFMLVKSGFDARVGYNLDRIFLLLPCQPAVYHAPFYTLGDRRYYLATFSGGPEPAGSLFIFPDRYPGADRSLDLRVPRAPTLESACLERAFRFTHQGREYDLAVRCNRPAVAYFLAYPQTGLEVYFGAPFTPETAASLRERFAPLLQGKTEAEAVSLLLSFVQSLPYATDRQRLGREDYSFPEAALEAPAGDCEDRAALFAALVRELTGLEVIGLDYPGHVAAAVRFSDDLPGDTVTWQGRRYLVCDPTYLDAQIGQGQPQYRGMEPKVIG
ncbi:MAG: hypothetical protein C4524_10270 [Candidatus Zixiibacteriota bacterium]|nr:MAG: hypothetical protein C4524_10270 [candidate division Zixibacteria bacterium]